MSLENLFVDKSEPDDFDSDSGDESSDAFYDEAALYESGGDEEEDLDGSITMESDLDDESNDLDDQQEPPAEEQAAPEPVDELSKNPILLQLQQQNQMLMDFIKQSGQPAGVEPQRQAPPQSGQGTGLLGNFVPKSKDYDQIDFSQFGGESTKQFLKDPDMADVRNAMQFLVQDQLRDVFDHLGGVVQQRESAKTQQVEESNRITLMLSTSLDQATKKGSFALLQSTECQAWQSKNHPLLAKVRDSSVGGLQSLEAHLKVLSLYKKSLEKPNPKKQAQGLYQRGQAARVSGGNGRSPGRISEEEQFFKDAAKYKP